MATSKFVSVRKADRVTVNGYLENGRLPNGMTEFRAQGDMPRGQQFGYVFGAGVEDWGWLLAHELGHGVFTLRHLDDGNYGAKDTLGSVSNLMNYTRSTELQAFQWNIMSNPAILTAFDSDDASKAGVPRPAPKIKPLATPILFARSGIRLGKDENGNIKEDLQQNPLNAEQKKLLGNYLLLSDDALFDRMIELAEWVSIGDGEKNALSLVNYFRANKNNSNTTHTFFTSEYMNQQLQANSTVNVFFTEGKESVMGLFKPIINKHKDIKTDIFPLTDGYIRSKRPKFNGWLDMLGGMFFAVHDISSFEVFITGFELLQNNTYNIEFKLVAYDHFGLDYADLLEFYDTKFPNIGGGFKSWYILQHDRGYTPFITKMECTRKYYNQKIE